MTEYQARLQEYQNIELALRNQVALYNNKYEEFEKSLTRSNKMFGGFKEEMENVGFSMITPSVQFFSWVFNKNNIYTVEGKGHHVCTF